MTVKAEAAWLSRETPLGARVELIGLGVASHLNLKFLLALSLGAHYVGRSHQRFRAPDCLFSEVTLM